MCGPLIQIRFNMRLDASQAAQGREERFMVGGIVKEELKVVGRVDSDGAVLDLRNGVVPGRTISLAKEFEMEYSGRLARTLSGH